MNETFSYPLTQPAFLLENFYILTWTGGMLALGGVWAIFFRYGNFKYGIDLGCFFKTAAIMIATMLALGLPNYFNVKYYAQHGHEGDKIVLAAERVSYQTRNGATKSFKFSDVQSIYKEPMTFNPPAIVYIVAIVDSIKADSIAVREDLPEFKTLLSRLDERTNGKVKKNL
jgi:hypothetical protein